MKIRSVTRLSLLLLGLIAMLVVLAVSTGVVLAQEDDDPPYMFFTVKNESQFDFTVWLYGPSKYELTVAPHSEEIFELARGWYHFTMFVCNSSDIGTFDFTSHQTMHVPICGSTAGPTGQSNQHMDASDYVRPRNITVRNRTLEPIEVYLRTLTEHHFLTFEPQEIKTVLITESRSEFVYSYVSCGVLRSGYYQPTTVPLDLTCKSK